MVKQMRFMIALFAMILFAVSLASANLIIIPSTTNASVVQGDSVSFTFKVNNTNDVPVLVSFENSTAPGIASALPTSFTLANNTTSDFLTITFSTDAISTSVGLREITLTAKGNDTNTSNNVVYKINVTKSIISEICGNKYTSQNISIGEIEDNEDGNENEWEWMPSNKISITINNIRNEVDDDEKFDVSLLFYKDGVKVSGSKIASDDDDLEINDLKINGEDDEDATFEFAVAGDADENNYDMYVKVDGKYGCYVEKANSVSIETEDGDYSIVSSVSGPVSSNCGETVDLAVTVSNIGDADADRVRVTLYNKDLGIKLYSEIDNLDQGDQADVSFSFIVPQSAVEKAHKLLLYTEFDYDDDDDSYDETSDDKYDYTYTLGLSGNCNDPTKPTITAKLNSSAVIGEDLVIAVTFKNNENLSISTIISPEDYDSWAEFVGVDPSTITVGKAESKTVYVTLKPTQAGQQTFNINAVYNGKSIDQPITVNITAKTGFFSGILPGMYNQFGKVGSYLLIGIIILVVLILIILLVRLILSRRD